MTIYGVKSRDDLLALCEEAGVRFDCDRPIWAMVNAVSEHGLKTRPGPDEECDRMACRLAVRNVDPTYRGYTPFGDI